MSVTKHRWHRLALALTLLGFGWVIPAKADVITADTSADVGMTGSLDLQFNPEGSGGTDTAVITSFTSDGTVGAVIFTAGDVLNDLNSLPVTVTDDQPLNELTQTFTFGNTLTINFEITINSGSPGVGFAFAMYDQNNKPIDAGSNGFSAVVSEVDATTGFQEQLQTGPGVTVSSQGPAAVPEPASLFLLFAGGVGLAGFSACRRMRYQPSLPYLGKALVFGSLVSSLFMSVHPVNHR